MITTVAGNGSMGFSGDGGLAGNAALNHPRGLAIDSTGAIQLHSNVAIYGLGIRYNGQAFTSIGAIIPGVN